MSAATNVSSLFLYETSAVFPRQAGYDNSLRGQRTLVAVDTITGDEYVVANYDGRENEVINSLISALYWRDDLPRQEEVEDLEAAEAAADQAVEAAMAALTWRRRERPMGSREYQPLATGAPYGTRRYRDSVHCGTVYIVVRSFRYITTMGDSAEDVHGLPGTFSEGFAFALARRLEQERLNRGNDVATSFTAAVSVMLAVIRDRDERDRVAQALTGWDGPCEMLM